MAKNSSIEWTHHTFNPWWGCVNVSPACKNCYAHTWAHRLGMDNLWGPNSARRFMSNAHWKEPIKWNLEAQRENIRRRVFCASMADVFEDRQDLIEHRQRLFELISNTPHLDWLLLTKRIHLVRDMVPWGRQYPENVWIGTTVEDQRRAEERLNYLVQIPSKIKFLSCEPLLSKVNLTKWIGHIDWVIAGGESGYNARPMHPDWLRMLLEQCKENSVAFHFKQWGNWFPIGETTTRKARTTILENNTVMAYAAKKKAGRVLDGHVWNEFPG